MQAHEVLQKILENEGLKINELAEAIDYPVAKLYEINRGKTKSIGKQLGEKIRAKYPKYNMAWLVSGEGDMYVTGNSILASGTIDSASLRLIIGEMAAQRENSFEVIRTFQNQVDRMLTFIENNISK
ncbi:MAG: hypothetical protein J5733_05720 [Bacteroidaceae bacterium]|nr:hypothetical protein [Bacteroidaceae bacterium]